MTLGSASLAGNARGLLWASHARCAMSKRLANFLTSGIAVNCKREVPTGFDLRRAGTSGKNMRRAGRSSNSWLSSNCGSVDFALTNLPNGAMSSGSDQFLSFVRPSWSLDSINPKPPWGQFHFGPIFSPVNQFETETHSGRCARPYYAGIPRFQPNSRHQENILQVFVPKT